MTTLRNMSRGGWIVVAVVATLLLVPTAAYAVAST